MANIKEVSSYVVIFAFVALVGYQLNSQKGKNQKTQKNPTEREYDRLVQQRDSVTIKYEDAKRQVESEILQKLISAQENPNAPVDDQEIRETYEKMRAVNLHYMNRLDSLNKIIDSVRFCVQGNGR